MGKKGGYTLGFIYGRLPIVILWYGTLPYGTPPQPHQPRPLVHGYTAESCSSPTPVYRCRFALHEMKVGDRR